MTPRGQGRSAGRSGIIAVLAVAAATLSGCTYRDALGLGWPKGITEEAHTNYDFWIAVVIASLVVGVIVWGLIFWTCVFHRKKDGDTELPRQFGYNMPLELVLTVVPFLIIGILFFFTYRVEERMIHTVAKPEVVIDVTAFQWNWKFGYQSVDFNDGTYGPYDGRDPGRSEAMVSRPEGTDRHGEELHGAIRDRNPEDRSYLHFDKIETLGSSDEIPVLVLPKGKRIEFQLAAEDVVHAFWVPEFLFKRDVMPNPKENHQENSFQITGIERTGWFVGRCAEMCGTYHSMMNFEIRVVEPNDFKAYMELRKEGKSNAEALSAIHQPPTAQTTRPFEARRGEQAPQTTR